MKVVQSITSQGPVRNQFVHLHKVRNEARAIFSAVGLGEQRDLFIMGLIPRKSKTNVSRVYAVSSICTHSSNQV